ncbi:MAG: hypothetical protein AAB626_01455 [Patescibacteria group bacterium]
MIKKLDSKDLKTTMIIIAQKKMKCKSKNYENTKAYKLYENTKQDKGEFNNSFFVLSYKFVLS